MFNEAIPAGARGLAALLLALALAVPAAAEGPAPPRIGLALGGGSARGLAHIGVLQWLDEHRIPVHFIAGTSVGGLIGGAYATGLSPAELRALMRGTNWNAVLLPESPFTDKGFRRKQDKRAFPARLELGLRRGVTLPRGINPGQAVGLMLDRIALAYYDIEGFDELPTAFRCLALDLRTAKAVVLSEGSLARAMRATMAIPGLFTPVSMGDWLLVDGGAVNNVPGDVVRDMGAEVVVAVDVSSVRQAGPRVALDDTGLVAVLDRTLDAMMAAGARKGLEQADVVLLPALQGIDSMGWHLSDDLADRGYRAAEAMAERLLPYALSEEDYEAYAIARRARRRQALPVLRSLQVAGVGAAEQAAIAASMRENAGQAADPDRIERGIRRLAGMDRYESIDYRIGTGPDGPALLLTVHPKTYGPPFLALGLEVNNIDATHVSASLAARLITYDTFGAGSEIRDDVVIGTRQACAREVFKPLGRSPFFLAPRVALNAGDRTWFDGDRTIGESRILRAGGGIDFGLAAAHSAEIRAGLEAAYVRGRPLIGTPALGSIDGSERFASLRAAVDLQDSGVVPSRGVHLRGQVRRFFATPRALPATGAPDGGRTPVETPSRFWQAEFGASLVVPIRGADRIFVHASGGTSFGARPLLNDFPLGGPFRLGAFSPEQLRGPAYALGVAGYLRKAGRVLGGDVFAGGWIEAGSAFEALDRASWHRAVSAGAIFDSAVGPVFAGGSLDVDGHARLYVAVGQVWR